MVSDFIKSPEGVKEYSKIGRSYPTELMENVYENDFLKNTSADPKLLAKHSRHRLIEVLQIYRKKVPEHEGGKGVPILFKD